MFSEDARMDSHDFSAKDTSTKQPASASLSDLDWSGANAQELKTAETRMPINQNNVRIFSFKEAKQELRTSLL